MRYQLIFLVSGTGVLSPNASPFTRPRGHAVNGMVKGVAAATPLAVNLGRDSPPTQAAPLTERERPKECRNHKGE